VHLVGFYTGNIQIYVRQNVGRKTSVTDFWFDITQCDVKFPSFRRILLQSSWRPFFKP